MGANDTDARIREEAYRLWEAEGWPVGRADLHWAAAKEIVAIRDSYASTLMRLEDTISDTAEPAIAFENQGEMPTLTDQGEGQAGPTRTAAGDSALSDLSKNQTAGARYVVALTQPSTGSIENGLFNCEVADPPPLA